MKLIDKDTLAEEIESKRKYAQTLGDNAINSSMQQFYDGMKQGCVDILSFLNTLEVKEVQEETESIWHDANQQPTMYRKYLVRYSDGRVSGSWERHDDGFIPWKDVVKEHSFTHWCYVEDLLKL